MQQEDTDQLDPDEPRTPGWLTLLGLGLFLCAGIFFLATAGDDDVVNGDQKEAPAAHPEQPSADSED